MNRNLYIAFWTFAASLAMLLSLLPAAHAVDTTGGKPAVLTGNLPGLHRISVRNAVGAAVPLAAFQGKVLLIVNTASQSGYAAQYVSLEKLYRRFKDRGLEVLAIPSNDFNNEEPADNTVIQRMTRSDYGISYPLFAKASVSGEKIAPLFAFLTGPSANRELAGPITESFTKFLVGRDGRLLARFNPSDSPTAPEMVAAVEAALNANGSSAGRANSD